MLPPSKTLLCIGLVLACLACSDGSTQPAANLSPRALLDAPPCALVGEEVDLDASASQDDDGRILEYRFLFGDGTAELRTTAPVARHAYDGPGTYELRLTAKDDRDASSSTRVTLRVLARTACAADTDCSPDEGCQGGLCRPAADGGVCARPPLQCPPAAQPCGAAANDLCDSTSLCVNGCCQAVKETP